MDVDAQIFPRRDLPKVGLRAPDQHVLERYARRATDRRTSAPPSTTRMGSRAGTAVMSVFGARLSARPELQISCFRDSNPKGFGLIQREREFDAYQDLEAHYQDRPSAWVEPARNWGDGSTQLVEIPTEFEYFDNIVAYWRPDKTLLACTAGIRDRLSSQLVRRRSRGEGLSGRKDPHRRRLAGGDGSLCCRLPRLAELQAGASRICRHDRRALAAVAGSCGQRQRRPWPALLIVQRNPAVGRHRVTFEFDPQSARKASCALPWLPTQSRPRRSGSSAGANSLHCQAKVSQPASGFGSALCSIRISTGRSLMCNSPFSQARGRPSIPRACGRWGHGEGRKKPPGGRALPSRLTTRSVPRRLKDRFSEP